MILVTSNSSRRVDPGHSELRKLRRMSPVTFRSQHTCECRNPGGRSVLFLSTPQTGSTRRIRDEKRESTKHKRAETDLH